MLSHAFPLTAIESLLERVCEPVEVEPNTTYRQIGIRSHGKGLFDKELVAGTQLGDKRVFWVKPNCFIVNIVFAWEQAVGKTTSADMGKIASHRFPMFRARKGRADVDFITYLFKTKRGKELLALASPGGAGRNKTLGQAEFLRIMVRIPPLSEQRKIAEILSTWDRAIAVQERLVANARAQKKALMQQLLTAKKRLPGFKGEWETTRFGDVFNLKNGLNGDKSLYGTGTKFVNVMDVFRGPRLRHHEIVGEMIVTPAQLEEFGVKRGDVLFNRTSETDDEIAFSTVYLDAEPTVFGGFVIRARPKNSAILPEFSVYCFQSETVRREMIRLGQGAIRSNIGQGDLVTVPFILPPIAEQRKIAEVLSTWDRAIAVQEKLAADAHTQMKALMQQLLTGKRRVTIEEAVA